MLKNVFVFQLDACSIYLGCKTLFSVRFFPGNERELMGSLLQIFIVAIGLSADAVSVCVAVSFRNQRGSVKEALTLAVCFGLFQGMMPIVGYVIGSGLHSTVSAVSEWIACLLLAGIGAKMIVESLRGDGIKRSELTYKQILILSIATSIDALIVGTSIRLLDLSLLPTVLITGAVTSCLCVVAYNMGKRIGKFFGRHIETIGGMILVLIALSFLFR